MQENFLITVVTGDQNKDWSELELLRIPVILEHSIGSSDDFSEPPALFGWSRSPAVAAQDVLFG